MLYRKLTFPLHLKLYNFNTKTIKIYWFPKKQKKKKLRCHLSFNIELESSFTSLIWPGLGFIPFQRKGYKKLRCHLSFNIQLESYYTRGKKNLELESHYAEDIYLLTWNLKAYVHIELESHCIHGHLFLYYWNF